MHYKDIIKYWHEGVLEADKKNYDSALENFTSIEDPPAKIWFNIGCIHLLRDDPQQALEPNKPLHPKFVTETPPHNVQDLKDLPMSRCRIPQDTFRGLVESVPRHISAFNQSVIKDPCLAVGFFQRSYVHFKLHRYEKALSDSHLSLAQLRSNRVIDYKQLGLRYLLFAWEVVYNTAVFLGYLGKWQNAEDKLQEAIKWLPGETKNSRIDSALDDVQRQAFLLPEHVPDGELFRPRKQEVEQLISKDFLGKPKVISSVVPNDQYSGFEPLRPQKPGFYEPCREGVLCSEAGYYRVVFNYYPEDSGEVTVKANTILYVLSKDGDWATAIHDGQKIFLPSNLLELMKNPPKADMKKAVNGIPLPPLRTPPNRPKVKPTQDQQGNLPSVPGAIPPRPEGKPPEPYKMNDFIPTECPVEICAPCAKEAPMDRPSYPRTEPVIERSVPVGMAPAVEISVPLSMNPVMERSVPLSLDPAVERSVPLGTDPVTEGSAPLLVDPRTDQAVDNDRIDPMEDRDVGCQSCPANHHETGKQVEGNVPQREPPPPPAADDEITLRVRAEFTVSVQIHKDITYTELQGLLRDKLKQQGEQMNVKLSYRDSDRDSLTPVNGDEDLQGILEQAPTKQMMFLCKDTHSCLGRSVLYRMQAVYEYPAEGPEDLTFIPGEIIDILSEVNEEWLEGHCNGNVGIFPKCFASRFEDE